jgi:hypothetical protein
MKKISIILLILFVSNSFAQTEQKNAIKLQINPILAGNIGLTYERQLNSSLSLSGTVNFTIPRKIPLSGIISEYTDPLLADAGITGISFSDFRFYRIGISPEIRYYTGRNAHSGFYLSGYVNFNRFGISEFSASMEDYNGQSASAAFKASVTNIGGGFAIGNQWVWGGFTLDITWVGVGVGSTIFGFTGTASNGENIVDFQNAADEVNGFFNDASNSFPFLNSASAKATESS